MKLISKTSDLLRGRIESEYNEKREHPIRSTLTDFSKGLFLLSAVVILFAVTTPALRSMIDYTIENYTTYDRKLDQFEKQLDQAENNMVKAALRFFKRIRNPRLEGIVVANVNGLKSIYPTRCTLKEKQIFYTISKWASENGYDAAIFGNSKVGLNGTLYWTDEIDDEYDTDVELIFNMLKEEKCKKIISFISNQENRFMPCNNYIMGELTILSDVQTYKVNIGGLKLWKDRLCTIINSDNFKAELTDNVLSVAVMPHKRSNEPAIISVQKEDFIDKIKSTASKKIDTATKWVNNII